MSKNTDTTASKKITVQKYVFISQMLLIIVLAAVITSVGLFYNIRSENLKRDQNLKNIASAIAYSKIFDQSSDEKDTLTEDVYFESNQNDGSDLVNYLDTLKNSLAEVDVISVVNAEGIRLYHSNHNLIGTVYDGTIPSFDTEDNYYAVNETGPSGLQRRAYKAIYSENNEYMGFVMAIMLMQNIRHETLKMLAIFAPVSLFATLIEILISYKISNMIKKRLMGYDPDKFSNMFRVRDDILESIDEGIVAVDASGNILYTNTAAGPIVKNYGESLINTLMSGEKEYNIAENGMNDANIMVDRIPNNENGGSVGIIHDRTEYRKLADDLAGTRFLVDSMRANNHEFTNKLHVILGLIEMKHYDEAISYIENAAFIQRELISKIMNKISDPSIAALLIGKTARSSELNVSFLLNDDSIYNRSDIDIPSQVIITIIGNLIDNALDAMNQMKENEKRKELLIGIFTGPGALLITVDDNGPGIRDDIKNHIFEKGISTKGEGRGTGLYEVKKLVDNLNGQITVESELGIGTSFTVSITKD